MNDASVNISICTSFYVDVFFCALVKYLQVEFVGHGYYV